MGRFNYVSDNGTTYRMRLDSSNQAAVSSAAATSTLFYPSGWVPRYLLCESATGVRRKVIVCDPTDDTWTGVVDSITLEVVGAVAAAFGITARIGEKRTSRG